MYPFKAYFWNNAVYINEKHRYSTNEVLVHCLNLDVGKLEEIRKRLSSLKHKLFLREQSPPEFINGYDDNAQRAQRLIHVVDELLRSIPLYADNIDSALLHGDKLFDCLNASYIAWLDSDDLEENFPDDNEYGFREDVDEHYRFYHTHFIPEYLDLSNDDPEFVLVFENANKAIDNFFNRYIAFIDDLLRVKYAFVDFLDNYINSNSKFLNEFETADAYKHFTGENARMVKPYQRFISAGTMSLNHAVLEDARGRNILCEAYSFDSLGAFLYLDLFCGLKSGYIPKRCPNCGKYFLLQGGKFSDYCERPLTDDNTKTCRDVGARKKYDDKCKTDPVWLTYNRAYKAHYARYMKKKMTTAEFEQWSAYAVELRTEALKGRLDFDEYSALIKK